MAGARRGGCPRPRCLLRISLRRCGIHGRGTTVEDRVGPLDLGGPFLRRPGHPPRPCGPARAPTFFRCALCPSSTEQTAEPRARSPVEPVDLRALARVGRSGTFRTPAPRAPGLPETSGQPAPPRDSAHEHGHRPALHPRRVAVPRKSARGDGTYHGPTGHGLKSTREIKGITRASHRAGARHGAQPTSPPPGDRTPRAAPRHRRPSGPRCDRSPRPRPRTGPAAPPCRPRTPRPG